MNVKAKILAGLLLCAGLSPLPARDLIILRSQIYEQNHTSVLELEVKNAGLATLMPIIWADLYGENNQHIGRFRSRRTAILPNRSAAVRIELDSVTPGRYSGLLVGQLLPGKSGENIRDTITLLGSLAPFELPILHSRATKVRTTQATRKLGAAPSKPTKAADSPESTSSNSASRTYVGRSQNRSDPNESEPMALETKERASSSKGSQSDVTRAPQKSASRPNREYQYYVVKRGDWLSKIALKFYGSSTRYRDIFNANKDILDNPNAISPGQRLKIPIESEVAGNLYTANGED